MGQQARAEHSNVSLCLLCPVLVLLGTQQALGLNCSLLEGAERPPSLAAGALGDFCMETSVCCLIKPGRAWLWVGGGVCPGKCFTSPGMLQEGPGSLLLLLGSALG